MVAAEAATGCGFGACHEIALSSVRHAKSQQLQELVPTPVPKTETAQEWSLVTDESHHHGFGDISMYTRIKDFAIWNPAWGQILL